MRSRRIGSTKVRCILIATVVGAPLAGAASAPVRNDQAGGTVNPPQTTNPIYYPIATAGESGVESVAPETLLRQFMERHTAMDYPAAAELALRLVHAVPHRPDGHYNLACALSRLHRIDEAIAALDQAVTCGWRDLAHLEIDLDLANLRRGDAEGYAQLIGKLKKAIDDERIIPGPLRTDPWEIVVADLARETPALLDRYHVPGAAMALIHDGEVVWTTSFGVRDRRYDAKLQPQDQFKVRAPLHLLAILACQQQDDLGRAQFAQLLMDGAEIDQASIRTANRRAPDRRLSTVGMTNPTSSEGSDRRQSRQRLNGHSTSALYGYLRLAVELASDQGFAEYCRDQIFKPLGMTQTSFENKEDPPPQSVLGHSWLGSPIRPEPASDDRARAGVIHTSAEDLARLIRTEMVDSNESVADAEKLKPPAIARALDVVEKIDGITPGGLGLALDITRADHITRVQVADVHSGVGCLIRWYPQSRRGIVILYNSATGPDAAERIAHLALGGE